MAINVNTVYQTVLLILNKEQRGYMTPLEFNKTGTQAQLEIFENYFDSLNQQIRIPQTDTDFASRVVGLDEKISIFKTSDIATYRTNVFKLPNQASGTAQQSQTFTANPISQTFTLTNNALTLSNSGAVSNVFINNIEIGSEQYDINGATLTLYPTINLNDIIIVNLYPKQFYRLGQVLYSAGGTLPTQEMQRVDKAELYHLLSSNLTKPTTTYPIYTLQNNVLAVHPDSITSGVSVSYIRKPLDPLWAFSQSGSGQFTYQQQNSINFEIHDSDQTELVLKILLYAGVVIRSPEIVQVAAQQVQQENINQQR